MLTTVLNDDLLGAALACADSAEHYFHLEDRSGTNEYAMQVKSIGLYTLLFHFVAEVREGNLETVTVNYVALLGVDGCGKPITLAELSWTPDWRAFEASLDETDIPELRDQAERLVWRLLGTPYTASDVAYIVKRSH